MVEMTTPRRAHRVAQIAPRSGRAISRRRFVWVLAGGGAVLGALSACGGSDDSPQATAPAVTATVPAGVTGGPSTTDGPAATRVEAGALVWATAIESGTNRPTAEVARIDVTTPVIYAVLPVSASPAGATLTAEWTFNTTPIQGVGASIQLPEVSEAPIWVEFHLERQVGEAWPDGTYTVIVREGDRVVGEGTIDVESG